MSLVRAITVFGMFLSGIAAARAQQNVPATTVQLPSYSVFTVQTSVSVPDGGGAYLGGLNSGASNSSRFGIGPLSNRGLSSSRSASGMSVSATVIDHEEIDRALLAQAAAKRGATDPAAATTAAKAATIGKAIAIRPQAGGSSDRSSSALPGSVAAIREENAGAADLQTAELAGYMAKARQAEADNKPGVAKVFYQMVARRDQGPLKQQAAERLASLTLSQR